ncbi:MAG: PQQ-binding-like beta-propeller repeat protein [archaeon]
MRKLLPILLILLVLGCVQQPPDGQTAEDIAGDAISEEGVGTLPSDQALEPPEAPALPESAPEAAIPEALTPPLNLVWMAIVLPSASIGWINPPTIEDGVVYVSSDYRRLQAYSLETGELIWEFATDYKLTTKPTVTENQVYVGSLSGDVYAVDKGTGTMIWKHDSGAKVHSAPALYESILISANAASDVIFGLNADTGQLVWAFEAGSDVYSSPALGEDRAYIGVNYKGLLALNPLNGNELWRFSLSQQIHSPVYHSGSVIFGAGDGFVYSLDASSGAQNWKYDAGFGTMGKYTTTPPGTVNSTVQINYNLEPRLVRAVATDGSMVYAPSRDKMLYALDFETGTLKWQFDVKNFINSDPIAAGGYVSFGTDDSKIYLLDKATGTQVWEYDLGGKGISPASLGNYLVIPARDGRLYAFSGE